AAAARIASASRGRSRTISPAGLMSLTTLQDSPAQSGGYSMSPSKSVGATPIAAPGQSTITADPIDRLPNALPLPARSPAGARAEHRPGRDRLDRRRQQCPDRCRALDVSASLDPLSDHGVDSGGGGRFRLVERTDLDDDPDTMSVCFLHVRRRIAPEEDDGRHPPGNRGTHLLARDRLVLVGRIALVDDEVDPEWPRGSVANLGDQPRDRVWKKGGCPDNPEAAGVGDRRSEIGARSCPHASR